MWRTLFSHLAIPLVLVIGMGICYLGAFHAPTPHNLKVALVGDTPQSMVFAQTLNNRDADALDARTVPSLEAAKKLVHERKVSAAYDGEGTHATLVVATAASPAGVQAAEQIFLPIAAEQGLPVVVKDVAAVPSADGSGQGLFFLMVALTIGGYATVGAVAAITGRVNLWWRAASAALVSGIVAVIGVLIAGPVFHVIDSSPWQVLLLAWLYVFGIVTVGTGLHPILGKWTTPTLTFLFVMLNITSSGGVFAAAFQPAVFAGLNTFWNGAAWLEAVTTLTYFPGQALGFQLLRLAIWGASGLVLIGLTHLWSVRRARLADEDRGVTDEELETLTAA